MNKDAVSMVLTNTSTCTPCHYTVIYLATKITLEVLWNACTDKTYDDFVNSQYWYTCMWHIWKNTQVLTHIIRHSTPCNTDKSYSHAACNAREISPTFVNHRNILYCTEPRPLQVHTGTLMIHGQKRNGSYRHIALQTMFAHLFI